MPLFWLRVAVAFYAAGLLYALALLGRRAESWRRIIMPIVSLGMVFHFVSLTEAARIERVTLASVHYSESLLAFLIMFVFMVVRVKYKTTSPGLFIFPIVFLLTFASAMAQAPVALANPLLRNGWVFAHIALIFTGYAALFLSFGASLLYLLQTSALKGKGMAQAGVASRLPSLETLDQIGYRLLLLGFPFITLGLVAGAAIAQVKYGPVYFHDPKVMLSLLLWVVYVVLLYTRWNNGWRGRRAACLAALGFAVALGAWAANYFSRLHRFVAP
jgi:ABC-type transport system involved in cytochrome c biogenesis permease subunit